MSSLTVFDDNEAISEAISEAQSVDTLIKVFNQIFSESERTLLAHSADEPIYIPAKTDEDFHTIYFAHGYFSSALHELSHWLVAGKERRQLEDFGYWYKPDGRTEAEQQEFEQVEVKPQAIEWFLAKCCGHVFHFSADNLTAGSQASDSFKRKVHLQAKQLAEHKGMEYRMASLVKVLSQTFSQSVPSAQDFVLDAQN